MFREKVTKIESLPQTAQLFGIEIGMEFALLNCGAVILK